MILEDVWKMAGGGEGGGKVFVGRGDISLLIFVYDIETIKSDWNDQFHLSRLQ
jgi:hypothetical protein